MNWNSKKSTIKKQNLVDDNKKTLYILVNLWKIFMKINIKKRELLKYFKENDIEKRKEKKWD